MGGRRLSVPMTHHSQPQIFNEGFGIDLFFNRECVSQSKTATRPGNRTRVPDLGAVLFNHSRRNCRRTHSEAGNVARC